MLQESKRNVLVHRVVLSQNQRDLQHAQTVEGHPGGAVSLIQMPSAGQRRAAIKYANVVEPEEATGEHVAPIWIFTVHPPIEIQHQALKGTFQEAQISPAQLGLNPVKEQGRPGMNRRVYVAEVPLVCGNLSVRMHVKVT